MQIKDRTFIISGGASGLGRATAVDLVAQGGYVAILDLNAPLGEQLISEITSNYSDIRARFFKCDVQKTEELQRAIEGTIKWIKNETGKELGGIISCAGVVFREQIISLPTDAPEETLPTPMSLDKAKWILGVNIQGTLDFLRLSLPHLAKVNPTEPDGERGVVILVSSSAAFDGHPTQVVYSASKGAIRSMTLPLARGLAGYGIRVIAVAPGLFDTPLSRTSGDEVRRRIERVIEFPKRAGKAEEFAHLVRYLIGNVMVNGEVVRLDGGLRAPSKL